MSTKNKIMPLFNVNIPADPLRVMMQLKRAGKTLQLLMELNLLANGLQLLKVKKV
jgi:hypothetical protein